MRELLRDESKRRPTLNWIEQLQTDPNFAPVRDADTMKSLTDTQREGWKNYWADRTKLRNPH